MTEWFLSVEAIHQVIPLIGISVTVAIIIFLSIIITRRVVKDNYEEILENRINEVADNVIQKYNEKISEVEELREELSTEKVYRKQSLKMLADLLAKLSK